MSLRPTWATQQYSISKLKPKPKQRKQNKYVSVLPKIMEKKGGRKIPWAGLVEWLKQ
jgi:hypothetical protein